jgi:Bacterial Ig-like domain
MRARSMRATIVLSVAAVLLALVVPAAAAPAERHVPGLAEVCEDLHETPATVPLCTHGADRVSTFGGHAAVREAPAAATPTDLAAMCTGDGVSGKRIEVIYGVPRDRPNRYATMLPAIRNVLAEVDGNLDAADAGTTQHYRWLCENGTAVTVRNVTLVPVGGDGVFNWYDYLDSLTEQVARGLGPVDYVADDRIYVAFVDQITDAYPYGGQGSVFGDDSPDPATNWNNNSTQYSMVAYYDAEVVAHEIGHNLGAVQNSAPHSSGGFHCHDELDMMCYSDGGPYFTGGGLLTHPCVTFTQDYVVDCGKDDYYYPGTPPAGSYLADHWNIADSGFLTALQEAAEPGDTTAPIAGSQTPTDGGTTQPVTTNASVTFSEDVRGVSATTFRLRTAAGVTVPATVSYNAATDVATLDPSANLAADTRYTATLTGGPTRIRDGVGNPAASTTWRFTTGR